MRVPGRLGYMVGQSSSGLQSVNTHASQISASVSGHVSEPVSSESSLKSSLN